MNGLLPPEDDRRRADMLDHIAWLLGTLFMAWVLLCVVFA